MALDNLAQKSLAGALSPTFTNSGVTVDKSLVLPGTLSSSVKMAAKF